MENWYDRIDDYHLGKLSKLEQEQFESAMTADPSLSEALWQRRTEWETGELLAEKILRAQIQEGFREHRFDSDNRFSKYRGWILAFLLLLVAAVLFFYTKQEPVVPSQEPLPATKQNVDTLMPISPIAQERVDPEPDTPKRPRITPSQRALDYKRLALASYRTPEGLVQTRSQTEDDSLSIALQAFNQKDFRLAALYLSPLPAGSGQEGLALRGHAHFLAGNYVAASSDFSDLLAGGVYIRDAQWFGLLAEMAAPGANKKELMQRLDVIRMNTKHPWQKDAAALWEKLKI